MSRGRVGRVVVRGAPEPDVGDGSVEEKYKGRHVTQHLVVNERGRNVMSVAGMTAAPGEKPWGATPMLPQRREIRPGNPQ